MGEFRNPFWRYCTNRVVSTPVQRKAMADLSEKMPPTATGLALPAELRNQIYAALAQNQEEVSIYTDGSIMTPPLMHVSKGTRREYMPVWLSHVRAHTPIIKVHIKDFVFDAPAPNKFSLPIDLRKTVCSLPPPAPGVDRTVVMRVWLTNALDSDVRVRDFCLLFGDVHHRLKGMVKLEICWDPMTFDENFSRELLPKLWFRILGSYLKYECQRVRAGRLVREAFLEAFRRYEEVVEKEREWKQVQASWARWGIKKSRPADIEEDTEHPRKKARRSGPG